MSLVPFGPFLGDVFGGMTLRDQDRDWQGLREVRTDITGRSVADVRIGDLRHVSSSTAYEAYVLRTDALCAVTCNRRTVTTCLLCCVAASCANKAS